MNQNRYVSVSTSLLGSVYMTLSKHDNLDNRMYSSELRKFVEEIPFISGETKNYTQGRAVKISVFITNLYNANKIVLEDNVSELLEAFENGLNSNITKVFASSARDVYTILSRHKKRVFKDAELYFIDETSLKELIRIKERLIENYINKSDDRLFGISKIVNVLNESDVCTKYDVEYLPRSKQINRAKSVERYIEGHFHAWKNNLINEHKEYIEVHKPDDITIERLKKSLELELFRANEEHEHIMKNKSNKDMKVRIIGHKNAVTHPRVTITTQKHTNNKHLRSEVPNALWFSPTPFRSDMEADEFIASAKHAYGDVYYIE